MRLSTGSQISVGFAVFSLCATIAWAAIGKVSFALPCYFVGLSGFTYMNYRSDKRKAANKTWRTPESTFHFLALLGGWPGAILAQSFLRHKTRKSDFLFIFWVMALVNLSITVTLLSPPGKTAIQNLMGG